MRVGRIGHASVVVSTDRVTCFVDPIFDGTFDSFANAFDPPVRVDAATASAACQVLVLSHHHGDHFSLPTLNRLRRDIPVFYPRGSGLIEEALTRLGFTDRRSLGAYESATVEDLTLVATPSMVGFPEMGVFFSSNGRSFWNLVDSNINDQVVATVRFMYGDIDLTFASYQAWIEPEIMIDVLGAEFPAESYGQYLSNLVNMAPRCVVPGACGVRFTTDWLNDRATPMSTDQFLDDVAKMVPAARTMQLAPGDVIDLDADFAVQPRGLPFVEPLSPEPSRAYDWRPDRGVPPLVDSDPRGHGTAALRQSVDAFLEGELVATLGHPMHAPWRTRMARMGVIWRLEVVYPDGTLVRRFLDLRDGSPRWIEGDARTFAKIHTSAAASAIHGLRTGDFSLYAAQFNAFRVALRLYELSPDGARVGGSVRDEPLVRVLALNADQRYLDHELRALGA